MLKEAPHQIMQLRAVEAEIIKKLLKSRFIKKCANKSIKLTELKNFIAQQNFYAQYFNRGISALLANLSNHHDFNLIDKLSKFLGEKDKLKLSHTILFKQLASILHIDKSTPVYSTTRQLIDAMLYYCGQPDPIYGVTALCFGTGTIVPILYLYIVSGFKMYQANGEQLNFFYANIECDHEHAMILRKILLFMIEEQPAKSVIVQEVAFEMIRLRTRFLDALVD